MSPQQFQQYRACRGLVYRVATRLDVHIHSESGFRFLGSVAVTGQYSPKFWHSKLADVVYGQSALTVRGGGSCKMVLLRIIRKTKRKEKEMRILMVYASWHQLMLHESISAHMVTVAIGMQWAGQRWQDHHSQEHKQRRCA